MREYKFRGRDGDDWYYGSLFVNECGHTAISAPKSFWMKPVNADTVGQYTGLLDSTGKEIYEGDIVRTDDWSTPSYIRWDVATASFVVDRWSVNLAHVSQIKVIGNVYDNPEMLEAHA